MRYEIGDKKAVYAEIDDKGVRITSNTGYKGSRLIPFDKIVSVSVKQPGAIIAGHIFFQTAGDSTNSRNTLNTVPFKGKENYALAIEIQAEVEKVIS